MPTHQTERATTGAGPATLRLERYDASRAGVWNDFVTRSKNGTFLFQRGYMDYHADRFHDHSLMAYLDDRLVALLPASERDDRLVSHGGLTYGGFVTDDRMRAAIMVELFDALRRYARGVGLRCVVYKVVPHIYHRAPADEDLYALYRHEARLIRRDVSSAIDMAVRFAPTKGRKWSTKRARANGLDVRRSSDMEEFMRLEEAHLLAKFGVRPTHSAAEMRLLADRFPDHIKLYAAYRGATMLGGTVVYESPCVVHAQYIAASDEGKELGAIDAIMDVLLNEVYTGVRYFDFGISTEKDGKYLNLGLIDNKESYGARAVVYDFYELDRAA